MIIWVLLAHRIFSMHLLKIQLWYLTRLLQSCAELSILPLQFVDDEISFGIDFPPFLVLFQLLDLCFLDVGSLQFSYSVLATSAMYHMSSQHVALSVSGRNCCTGCYGGQMEQNCLEKYMYRQVPNTRRTKSQHLKDSPTVLRLSLPHPLKPVVKSRMKM